MGFFTTLRDVVNTAAGSNYREIFFSRYPGPEYSCKGCVKSINRNIRNDVHIDHIVPQVCGGTNVITNLQTLCASCNTRKKDIINMLSLEYSGSALLRELKKIIHY
jgi:5-methylcytosine-specific restriction endonuclease McrA